MRAIHDEKCTALKGPPSIFVNLLNHPDFRKYDLSSLEQITIAPSTFPKELIAKAKRMLNIKHVIIGYGMSESSCMGSMTRVGDLEKSEKFAYESIGQGVPYTELKIVGLNTNKIVPRNVDGEIYLKGYNVMKGYWNEPEKTAETLNKEG
jgi:fatty-acyl-CoA synthase